MEGKTRPSVLQKALKGDAREFAELYGCMAYGIARKRGLGHHDSEDVAQQTLLNLWELLPDFRYDPARGTFRGLVKKIALNRLTDFLRKRKISSTEEGHVEEPFTEDGLTALVEREWEKSAWLLALERVRSEVKPSTFQSFQLNVLKELPADEVSRTLGLTRDQVYQNKKRVLDRLRFHFNEIKDESL